MNKIIKFLKNLFKKKNILKLTLQEAIDLKSKIVEDLKIENSIIQNMELTASNCKEMVNVFNHRWSSINKKQEDLTSLGLKILAANYKTNNNFNIKYREYLIRQKENLRKFAAIRSKKYKKFFTSIKYDHLLFEISKNIKKVTSKLETINQNKYIKLKLNYHY